jgi:drug/metabolite transporter (DMT)-like permease
LNKHPEFPTYKGRTIGIVILTTAQLFIGGIHIFFGVLLLAFEDLNSIQATVAYDVYTVVFGILVAVFAFFIWHGKKVGWVGTIAVSVFVSGADTLTLMDLPSIPGIPKAPALAEIAYSLIIIQYLSKREVRKKFWS